MADSRDECEATGYSRIDQIDFFVWTNFYHPAIVYKKVNVFGDDEMKDIERLIRGLGYEIFPKDITISPMFPLINRDKGNHPIFLDINIEGFVTGYEPVNEYFTGFIEDYAPESLEENISYKYEIQFTEDGFSNLLNNKFSRRKELKGLLGNDIIFHKSGLVYNVDKQILKKTIIDVVSILMNNLSKKIKDCP